MSVTHSRLAKFKKAKWLFNRKIEIPNEWELNAINKFAQINPEHIQNNYKFQKIQYVDISSIENFQIIKYEKYTVAERPSRAQRIIKIDDLIISTVRPNLKSFSKVKKSTPNLICSTGFTVVRPNIRSDVDFLFSYFQSHWFEIHVFRHMEGLAYPAMTSSDVANFIIAAPSNSIERLKIASILSGVDAIIEATQKTIEKTKRLKKGLIQQLLARGINHEKFKKVKWLFGKEIKIPKEWEIKQLISVSSQKPEYGSGDAALPHNSKLARYIRITDIDDEGRLKNEKVSAKLINNKQYVLNQDDFLFARTGSVGRTFLFSTNYGLCVYAGYLIRFKLNKRKILPIFLHHYTHSNIYWTWLTSELTQGVQPNVNAQQYSKLPIVLPSLTEQSKIASILSGVDAIRDCVIQVFSYAWATFRIVHLNIKTRSWLIANYSCNYLVI